MIPERKKDEKGTKVDKILGNLRISDRFELRKKTRDPFYFDKTKDNFEQMLGQSIEYISQFKPITKPHLFQLMSYKEMRDYQNKVYASDL
jgi:hypothetical protein